MRVMQRILIIVMLPVLFFLFSSQSAFSYARTCTSYFLRTDAGKIINPISGENADQPYSTKQTCGKCHDYDTISNGYHFKMDWDKADDNRFKDTEMPFKISTGLTGSFTPIGYYQLAKKKNRHPDEIDLTAFDFVARTPVGRDGYLKPSCAGCHAGGGLLEHDRDGFRYDKRLSGNPELSKTPDGDYYNSQWDKTGVIEVDCFFCHSTRYNMQSRIKQIEYLNFRWASVAASGIGQVQGSVADNESPKVVYNRRLFNEDGSFVMPSMTFRPDSKNCLLCHSTIETGKRGTSWGDPENPDVHNDRGLTCIDCHFGDINHNLAKGDTIANTVRDDLDNSMRSCEDCHTTGYKGATLLKHNGVRKDHLDRISCQTCHIPELKRAAIGAMYVNTGGFRKSGQVTSKKYGEPAPWKPAYAKRKTGDGENEKIYPVNPIYTVLFSNKSGDGKYWPLFLSEIETAYKQCKSGLGIRAVSYDFHDHADIKMMLETFQITLSGNKRFKFVNPYFHNAGTLYSLDDKGALKQEKDNTWVANIPFFSVNHNVAPLKASLGAGGCKDCHASDAHMFNGPVVTDYFGDNGKPVFTTTGSLLGYDASTLRLGRLFYHYFSKAVPLLISIMFIALLAGVLKDYLRKERLQQSVLLLALTIAVSLLIIHCLVFDNAVLSGAFLNILMPYTSLITICLIVLILLCFLFVMLGNNASTILNNTITGIGILMFITGGCLMNKSVFPVKALFIFSIAHGLLAIFFSGLFILFIYGLTARRTEPTIK